MTVVPHADAAAFLAATEGFRSAEPLQTNIIGSVAIGVVRGRVYESELWLTVHGDSDEVVGMGMRTAPRRLNVSPMPVWAARELGQHVAEVDPDLPGVTGPGPVVDAVVDALQLPAHRGHRIALVEVLYRLTELRVPEGVPGSARRATASDRALLLDWHASFADDAGLDLADVAGVLDSRLLESALWLWEVDGRPVSMAGHAPVVEGAGGPVGRVGPVFTSEADRGHGYAAAVTATVVNDLLARCAQVILYADAANPTSNRLYQRLGFTGVSEIVEVVIEPHPL